MSVDKPVRRALCRVLMIMGVLGMAADAAAQSGVGGGPLTSTLPDAAPTVGVLSAGPVKIAPGITVRQLGWDDNIFDEPESESPKEDWVISAMPDVSLYSRLRLLRRWKMPRALAVSIVIVLFGAAMLALLLVVVPVLQKEIPLLQAAIPAFLAKLNDTLGPRLQQLFAVVGCGAAALLAGKALLG